MSSEKIVASLAQMDDARRKTLRANAEANLKNPAKADDARKVIAALDAQVASERNALVEQVRAMPQAERVIDAFSYQPMSETERKIVQVLLDHPGKSSEGLSQELGWGGQTWHMHFGEMCRKRETRLWPAAPAETRNANFYCGILANIAEHKWWSMKPDAAEGFAALGLRPQDKAQR